MPYIYLIRLHGEPKYVGYTRNTIKKRWNQHTSAARKGYPQAIYNAMRKHGEGAFTIEVLMEHDDETYLRDVMEPKFIKEYQTHVQYGIGYNLTDGGEGANSWIPSHATRKRISDAKRGEVRSEESRKRISDSKRGVVPWMKGKRHTEEARKKMSVSKKGKPSPKKGIKGKPHTEETRKKMSESHQRRLAMKV